MTTGNNHDPSARCGAADQCAEALVAGTLALMTALVDPSPSCRFSVVDQRFLLARKVVANLHCLKDHPSLSEALRAVMREAHGRWLGIAQLPKLVETNLDEQQMLRDFQMPTNLVWH